MDSVSRNRTRWVILALLFAASVLNYVDRQTLSILAPTIQADIGMSDADYATVVQLFLTAYTLAYLVVGWITDRLGAKLALAAFVGWWSIANLLSGLAGSMAQLGTTRFLLGLGEAGNYVAAPKTVAERFPVHERGFAIGVYTAGAMAGATIAPPLIGWIALTGGWRAAFLVTGGLGLVWIVGWLLIFPAAHADRLGPSEQSRWPIGRVLRHPAVWGLMLARAITDPVWYFYLFWFPKYLIDTRGMSLLAVAATAWLVYLAADIGSVGGGHASGRLVRRGHKPVTARLRLMALAAMLAPVGAFLATQPSMPLTFLLAAAVALAHMAFLVNLTTLSVDLFPERQVGTILGLIAAGSGIGGVISTGVVGAVAATRDYSPLFLAMGVLHPAAWLVARAVARSSSAQRTI